MKEMVAATVRAAERHHVVALARSPNSEGFGKGAETVFGNLSEGKAIASALKQLRSARVFLHFDRTFELRFQATFATSQGVLQAKKLVERGRDLALRHLDELGEVLAERFVPIGGPKLAKDVFGFFRCAEPALRDLRLVQKDKTLRAQLKVTGRGALWSMAMAIMPGMGIVRGTDPE
jgi:hypothetical protein